MASLLDDVDSASSDGDVDRRTRLRRLMEDAARRGDTQTAAALAEKWRALPAEQ